MERSTRKIALVGIILLVVGLIAWIMQLTGGLLAGSNMTNVFLWGLMIAVFAFLVGFGAGSQFVASAIILRGKRSLSHWHVSRAHAGLLVYALLAWRSWPIWVRFAMRLP